jgi:hypothetical protein
MENFATTNTKNMNAAWTFKPNGDRIIRVFDVWYEAVNFISDMASVGIVAARGVFDENGELIFVESNGI